MVEEQDNSQEQDAQEEQDQDDQTNQEAPQDAPEEQQQEVPQDTPEEQEDSQEQEQPEQLQIPNQDLQQIVDNYNTNPPEVFSHFDGADDDLKKVRAIYELKNLKASVAKGGEGSAEDYKKLQDILELPREFASVLTPDQTIQFAEQYEAQYLQDVRGNIHELFKTVSENYVQNLEKAVSALNKNANKDIKDLKKLFKDDEWNTELVKELREDATKSYLIAKGGKILSALLEIYASFGTTGDKDLDLMTEIYTLTASLSKDPNVAQALNTKLVQFTKSIYNEKTADNLKKLFSSMNGNNQAQIYEVALNGVFLNVLKKTDNVKSEYSPEKILEYSQAAFDSQTVDDDGNKVPDRNKQTYSTGRLAAKTET
jgi:hypothetical protein